VRILLVSPFDFGYPGGVNEHVAELDRQFQRLGHDTRILAATSLDVGELDDGHVCRIGAAVPLPSNGSRARIAVSPLVTLKVRQFLQTERFDVIHLHEPLTPMLCLAVLLHSKSVNVGTFHAARPANLLYHYTKAILDMFFDKLDARIAVSEPAREFVDAYFPAQFDIVPNGISVEQFRPDVEPLPELMDGKTNILFVGRFDEARKGFRYLARAMPLIRQQFPSLRLVVVGQGDPARWERYFAKRNIEVVFAGFVDPDLKPRYFASCDVFCAPSTGRESFGLILLEALATGKPVVATAIPGYSGVIRNGIDGVLVEPKDHNALALAIVRVLADGELRDRLTANALQHVRQFSWPVVAQRVLAVYERAIAESATPSGREWPLALSGRP
jgi:phosphatidylinositol alpha-mannosyltransferase